MSFLTPIISLRSKVIGVAISSTRLQDVKTMMPDTGSRKPDVPSVNLADLQKLFLHEGVVCQSYLLPSHPRILSSIAVNLPRPRLVVLVRCTVIIILHSPLPLPLFPHEPNTMFRALLFLPVPVLLQPRFIQPWSPLGALKGGRSCLLSHPRGMSMIQGR